MKNFQNTLSWDGIIAICAILGLVIGAVIYDVNTSNTADAAKKTADKVASHQSEVDIHLSKIDSAIGMLSSIIAERTGKSVVLPNGDSITIVPSSAYGQSPQQVFHPSSQIADDPPTNSVDK